jgi:N-acetylglucosamine-6-phosphate deacetylase
MLALTAATLFTPSERVDRPLVLVEDGRVVEITSCAAREVPAGARLAEFGDAVLSPGLIDIHIHGSAGHDVMEADSGALPAVERLLAQHGVSSYLPTTVTAPLETILSALDRLATAVETQHGDTGGIGLRARPLGIHLEGPFISHTRRGVHAPDLLLHPSCKIFEDFWQAARGHLRVMTIAPELPGSAEVIAAAVKRGVCVSLGHSDADFKTARVAVAAGARHATHTFNAMRPLSHREPGIIGEVLTDSRMTADIIADGIHLDPAIVKLVLLAKGVDSAVLISDAISATGMPDGQYRLGSLEVEVKNGKCLYQGKLAGSVLTLDQAVRNVMGFANWNLQQALRPATLNPARVLGIAERKGTLVAGAEADIVVLSASGEVRKTIICGRVL